MTTKKHSKSKIEGVPRASKASPSKPTLDTAALKSAARFVTIACDHETSPSTMDPADRLELVRAAGRRIIEWFRAVEGGNPSATLYEALGVLELVEHALMTTVDGELGNDICDPVQGGLDAAERLLRQGIRTPLDLELVSVGSTLREAS